MLPDGTPPEAREKYHELTTALTGEEPCAMEPDLYTENWTNRGLRAEEARTLCADCPVLDLCRDYAMTAKEPYHVWGGTVPSERGVKHGDKPWTWR